LILARQQKPAVTIEATDSNKTKMLEEDEVIDERMQGRKVM
jgi:hypothetical protein